MKLIKSLVWRVDDKKEIEGSYNMFNRKYRNMNNFLKSLDKIEYFYYY